MDDLPISTSWIIFSDMNLDFIRELCARRINLNFKFDFGFTIFHHAVNIPEDNIEVVKELIRAGADVNVGTNLNFTPLHFAVMHRKERVFNELINSGASVNAQTFLGTTALHIAVTELLLFSLPVENMCLPNTKIMNELLQHEDIDCNLVDSNGDSPLMIAVKNQQIEAAVNLLHCNADPNIPNKESETPLHVAFAKPGSLIEIRLLLNGASIYAIGKMGQTPVDILIKIGLHLRTNEWVLLLMKIIAYKCCITNDVRRKLECKPWLLQFLNKCCHEVDRMKIDFISEKITVYDFIGNCFNEDEVENPLLEIHKPVVERLVRGNYNEYFSTMLDLIPESSMITILELTICSRKHTKNIKVNDLTNLLSITDNIYLISNYLSKIDVFCLIIAFSNMKLSDSMQNVHEREFSYFFKVD